jgi:hypothetical protein
METMGMHSSRQAYFYKVFVPVTMTYRDNSIPLWMRTVISLCAAKHGEITSEEIANVAATAGRYSLGWDLVNALKKSKHIRVEVVGEGLNERAQKIKIYRVTRHEVARITNHESRVTAIQ